MCALPTNTPNWLEAIRKIFQCWANLQSPRSHSQSVKFWTKILNSRLNPQTWGQSVAVVCTVCIGTTCNLRSWSNTDDPQALGRCIRCGCVVLPGQPTVCSPTLLWAISFKGTPAPPLPPWLRELSAQEVNTQPCTQDYSFFPHSVQEEPGYETWWHILGCQFPFNREAEKSSMEGGCAFQKLFIEWFTDPLFLPASVPWHVYPSTSSSSGEIHMLG